MRSQAVPVLLNLVAAGVGAFGQFFYKRGSQRLSTVPLWRNLDLAIGCLLFCGVMVLFVAAYRMGGKMSVVYPFYSTTFIWSTAIAVYLAGEPVSPVQWAGVFAVAFGTAAIAFGQGASHV